MSGRCINNAIRNCCYTEEGECFNPMKASLGVKITAIAIIAIVTAGAVAGSILAGLPIACTIAIGVGVAALATLIAFIILKKLSKAPSEEYVGEEIERSRIAVKIEFDPVQIVGKNDRNILDAATRQPQIVDD